MGPGWEPLYGAAVAAGPPAPGGGGGGGGSGAPGAAVRPFPSRGERTGTRRRGMRREVEGELRPAGPVSAITARGGGRRRGPVRCCVSLTAGSRKIGAQKAASAWVKRTGLVYAPERNTGRLFLSTEA